MYHRNIDDRSYQRKKLINQTGFLVFSQNKELLIVQIFASGVKALRVEYSGGWAKI